MDKAGLTSDREVRALVEETDSLATATTEDVVEETGQDARVLLGVVARLDLLVAARKLRLAAGVLGLLKGQLLGVLVATVGAGKGHGGGGEGSGNSEELHFDGLDWRSERLELIE